MLPHPSESACACAPWCPDVYGSPFFLLIHGTLQQAKAQPVHPLTVYKSLGTGPAFPPHPRLGPEIIEFNGFSSISTDFHRFQRIFIDFNGFHRFQ
eukprot:8960504-Alexandrium_andersonii.AAC.1